MNTLIPEFHWYSVLVEPWTSAFPSTIAVVLMGFFAATACGLLGVFLILRRMALVGDAMSHSVLPGLVGGFLLAGTRSTWVMFAGALVAAMVTTVIIEFIHEKSRVKQDAAIGITFSTLFAVGVILITLFADKVDLDQDCVLYGDMTHVGIAERVSLAGLALAPPAVIRMGVVAGLTALGIGLFYRALLVSSFDPGLSVSLGIKTRRVHHALMIGLSIVVVSAFEAAGAILVIAMLIVPGATLLLLTHSLPRVLWGTVIHAALSTLLGFHLAMWLECSVAAAMVVASGGLFLLAWLASPTSGLITRWAQRRANTRAGSEGAAFNSLSPEPGDQGSQS
jgi:manganese/zinc/iron transport system permease protein